MLPFIAKPYKKLLTHKYGLSLCIYLCAAILTGMGCVLFMRAFEFVYEHQLSYESIGNWCWLATPVLFLIAVQLICVFAPAADGAGIPQTIFAAKHLSETNFKKLRPLVSFKTMTIKIAALLIGLWAGASTGREGPTVHVAACLFFGITYLLHRFFKLQFNIRSAIVAGGAAGLAAAFNTPLAGVTFAIEELSSDYFVAIKDMVLLAIIVAGISAQVLTGEYIYFGQLSTPAPVSIMIVLLTGILGGLAGTFFSVVLTEGKRFLSNLKDWQRYLLIVILAWAVLFLAIYSGMKGIAGPGNIAAQSYVEGRIENAPFLFTIYKMMATLFTYWSGIAGGIFAPCLAMGSAIGAWIAQWQNGPIAVCAMLGMASFLSGTIQAPITAFVIIYEMTGHHEMLLPIMLASLIGYMIAKILKAKHLYQALASYYEKMC